MGVVGGAEAAGGAGRTGGAARTGGAGAGSARTWGPVGGSGRDLGSGGAAAGNEAEYDGSGWAAGGDAGTPTAWPMGAVDGGGGPGGEGGGCGGCGRLQAEKGGSGLDIGGNSDAGGPDDAAPDGGVPDGDLSRGSAGAAEERSVWCPRGAKGRRAETRNPHASQNWPTTADPQRGQLPLATNRPGA
jgi:hypothetical protein